jgi:hypothetical protein
MSLVADIQQPTAKGSELADVGLMRFGGDNPGLLRIQGFDIPDIMVHGTTVDVARRSLLSDDSYSCQWPNILDATIGDVRAWPKGLPQDSDVKRAIVVFSTRLAFSPESGGSEAGVHVLTSHQEHGRFTRAHLRFKHLPPGSFEILWGDKIDFGNYHGELPVSLAKALKESEEKLILKAKKKQ